MRGDLEEERRLVLKTSGDNCPRQEQSSQAGMFYPEQVSPKGRGDRLCSDDQERVMGFL